jgi:myo-inositol-hexaphosphate 3-phosphohydrolase
LGAGLEAGLFIAQDDEDDAGNQNFKLVPWSAITDALSLKP